MIKECFFFSFIFSYLRSEAENIYPGQNESMFGAFLNILWNYLEIDEVRYVLKKLANALLSEFTHTNKGLDYEQQRQALQILICLCNHTKTRKNYLEFKFFKKH